MNKEKLRDMVYIIVAILVSVIAIHLFIWLLPIILIACLAFYLYGIMKNKDRAEKEYEDNKTKRKKIVIIDEEKD